MIKNELAITIFKRFVEENDRIPTCQEFIEIGYSRSHYYNMKKIYLEQEAKKAINEVLRNEAIKGKI